MVTWMKRFAFMLYTSQYGKNSMFCPNATIGIQNCQVPDVYYYPLRPEFAESTYFLYQATKSPFYLHVAKSIIENINTLTRVKCGFATVHDVLDKSLEDRQESFFLSETLKYLYLIFDKEHFLNNDGALRYIFTTVMITFLFSFVLFLFVKKNSRKVICFQLPMNSKTPCPI
jgi:hypothetical protein